MVSNHKAHTAHTARTAPHSTTRSSVVWHAWASLCTWCTRSAYQQHACPTGDRAVYFPCAGASESAGASAHPTKATNTTSAHHTWFYTHVAHQHGHVGSAQPRTPHVPQPRPVAAGGLPGSGQLRIASHAHPVGETRV